MHGEPFTEHKSTFQVGKGAAWHLAKTYVMTHDSHVGSIRIAAFTLKCPRLCMCRKLPGRVTTSDSCQTEMESGCQNTFPDVLQAHLAPASSAEDVERCMNTLLQHNKIRNATHNILAYRVYVESRDAWLQVSRRKICTIGQHDQTPCIHHQLDVSCLALPLYSTAALRGQVYWFRTSASQPTDCMPSMAVLRAAGLHAPTMCQHT